MTTKIVNGVEVELTQAEIDARAAEEAAWQAGALDRALDNLRAKRNILLIESDPWMFSDHPKQDTATTAEIEAYRQSLRDITNDLTTEAEVLSVVWPTKP